MRRFATRTPSLRAQRRPLETLERRVLFAAGDPDTTFSGDGMAFIGASLFDEANAVVVQPDGKVIVAGSASDDNTFGGDFLVARFLPNGDPDPTFAASGGIYRMDMGGFDDVANALLLQPDGKILIGGARGSQSNGNFDFALVRLNPNGLPDTTFGTQSQVFVDFGGSSEDRINALALQPDGKIVAAGLGTNGNNMAAVARFNADGTPDTTFGTGGKTAFLVNGNLSEAHAVTLQGDGKIVLAVDAASLGTGGGVKTIGVTRLMPNGTPDGTFGTGGSIVDNVGVAFAGDIAVASDGDIYVAATRMPSSPATTALYKYTPTGGRRTTFGTNGAVDISTGGFFGTPLGLVVQPDNKVVVAATSSSTGGSYGEWTIARVLPTGILDSTFGTGGKVVSSAGPQSQVHDVALAPDGKIVVAGYANGDMMVARYLNDAGPPPESFFDTTFSGDGVATTDFAGTSDFGSTTIVQPDQKIVVGGSVGNGTNTDDVFGLTRYNPDGSLDVTFGTAGKATVDFGPDADLESIALAPDGKLVAVGRVTAPGAVWDWAIARFNANGTIDTTFGGGDGMVTTDFFGFGDLASGVLVQSDGKIIVAGMATAVTTDMAIVRYNTDGSIDTSFANAGRQFIDAFGGVDFASTVKLQPDNKLIVVGGSVQPGSYRRFVLSRLNANGTFDATFDTDGVATADFGASAFGKDVEVLSDGRYVVGGWVDTNPSSESGLDFTVARFNSNGTLDGSFGTSGRTVIPGTSSDAATRGMGTAIQSDGKILLGGTIRDPGYDTNFMTYGGVARFNANGTVDSTFGVNGVRQFTIPGTAVGSTKISDIALQADGKILAAGYPLGSAASTDFAVVRMLNDVVPPPPSGSISGVVYNDLNENGVRDAGEAGLAGWTIYQDLNNNGRFDNGAITIPSTNVPVAISDQGTPTIVSNLVVSNAPASISDINVTVNIQHTWDRDLIVTLISPTEQQIQLFNRVGSSGDNFTNTTLDDEASQSITAGTAPFTGSFRPQQPLSALDGINPNGTWQLRIQDVAAGSGGSLDSWSITLQTAPEPSTISAADGTYTLSNVPAGDHVIREIVQPGWSYTAPAGNAHAVTVAPGEVVTGRNFGNTNRVIPTAIVGRAVFYNNSLFDGRNIAADAQDDAAVATDKQALLPGQAARFSNITSYVRGINGVMIDMQRMSSDLGAEDFEFRVGTSGTPSGWTLAPAPLAIIERSSSGAPGNTRVTIVWPDSSIRNKWLQVTVKANARTGLTSPDVFYFGNLVGDTTSIDPAASSFRVDARDVVSMRSAYTRQASVTNPHDINRDGRVDVRDEAIVRDNYGRSLLAISTPIPASFGDSPIVLAGSRLRAAPITRSVLA